jgi:hypothetical protein
MASSSSRLEGWSGRVTGAGLARRIEVVPARGARRSLSVDVLLGFLILGILATGGVGVAWAQFSNTAAALLSFSTGFWRTPTATSPVVSPGCTHTAGYWKNHPDAWPVDELLLGAQTYTQAELLTLLETAPQADASLMLARQLIAAKLNVASGVDDAQATALIDGADDWLDDHEGKLPYDSACNLPDGQQALALAQELDAFNSGATGPGACEPAEGTPGSDPALICPLPSPCTETPTPTATPTPTQTPPMDPPDRQTATATATAQPTPTPTPTPTTTAEPTRMLIGTPPDTPEPTAPLPPGSTATSLSTPRPTHGAVLAPTPTPSRTPKVPGAPVPPPVPSVTATPEPAKTVSPEPSDSPSPTPEPTREPTEEPRLTSTPTWTPTPSPTPTPLGAGTSLEAAISAAGFWSGSPDLQLAGVDGQILVLNSGGLPTEHLEILAVVQTKLGSGSFADYLPVLIDLDEKPVLDPGEEYGYAYEIDFAPLEGCTYRIVARITISNHVGWLPGSTNCPGPEPCPFGPEPKADFALP